MNQDLAISLIVNFSIVLLAAGGMLVKVNRLEADMKERVTRELFDLHTKRVDEKLDEIKTQNERILDRLFRRQGEESGEHPRRT